MSHHRRMIHSTSQTTIAHHAPAVAAIWSSSRRSNAGGNPARHHHRQYRSGSLRHDPAWLAQQNDHCHCDLIGEAVRAYLKLDPDTEQKAQRNTHQSQSDGARHGDNRTPDSTPSLAAPARQIHPKALLPIDRCMGLAGSSMLEFRTQAPEILRQGRRCNVQGSSSEAALRSWG